jgi:ATP-dependent exoDNAse (exonuclease V) beta subunit
VERDRNEGHRVAYVAATRARDLLVVPAVGDAPFEDGWVSGLNDAIYPPAGRRRDAEGAPAVPAFKRDTVLQRPGEDPARADTMHPGRHRFGDGADRYDVVWWDPGVLDLDRRPPMGVRHETLIGKDAPRAVVDETLAAFRAWDTTRTSALEAGARPSLSVRTASEWAESGDSLPGGGTMPEVAVQEVDHRQAPRPSGAGFGSLVHAVLATVALDGSPQALQEAADAQARLLGASAADATEASAVAARVLASPLARRAAQSSRCRREVPVTLSDDNGAVVEGVVDLVFEEGGRSVVVDFKTDVEIGRVGLERYRRQVGLYAAAVGLATRGPVEAILLRV